MGLIDTGATPVKVARAILLAAAVLLSVHRLGRGVGVGGHAVAMVITDGGGRWVLRQPDLVPHRQSVRCR